MVKFIKLTIKLLLIFSFSLFVNCQKTEAELSNPEERIPVEIFMKDEPRRQDSNEESLTAMHLCMDERDQKERLITCDRRYSSKFACVGAWEGNIQECDKFNKKQVAAAICVQANSSYVSICEYKNLKSAYLCFPRKLTNANDYNGYHNSAHLSTDLRKNIRPCSFKQRRICLYKGAITPCIDIGQNESKVQTFENSVELKRRVHKKNYENIKTSKPIKSRVDQSRLQNVSYKTNHSLKILSNPIAEYITINLLSRPKSQENEPAYVYFDKDKNESRWIQSISNTTNPSSVILEEKKRHSISKFNKSKVSPKRDFLEFSNDKDRLSTLNQAADKIYENKGEQSHFQTAERNSHYHISKASNRGKNNRKLNYMRFNIRYPRGGVTEFSNQQKTAADQDSSKKQGLSISRDNETRRGDTKPTSFEKQSGFEKEKYSVKESKVLQNKSGKRNNKTDKLVQTSKLVTSTYKKSDTGFEISKEKHPNSKTRGSVIGNSEESIIIEKRAERRPGENEQNLEDAGKTTENPRNILFRAPRKKERPTTEKSKITQRPFTLRSFFYVLKCKDCDIDNEMIVEKELDDIIPEIETFRFKS